MLHLGSFPELNIKVHWSARAEVLGFKTWQLALRAFLRLGIETLIISHSSADVNSSFI
jgi:hypothetical protein